MDNVNPDSNGAAGDPVDVLRVELLHPDLMGGSINLARGAKLLRGIQVLVQSAAWAAVQPGQILEGSKPSLTNKYLKGIPEGSRATQGKSLTPAFLNERAVEHIRSLNAIAERRGQTLAQMAIAWVLRDGGITSALIGASRPAQVEDCVGAIGNLDFTADELAEIDRYADEENINLWAKSSETA